MSDVFMVPQGYPLYVAWREPYTTRDDREVLEEFAAMTIQRMREIEARNCETHLVIAWEMTPDTVPVPVVPDIGQDGGRPVYGLSRKEVVEQYLDMAEVNHAAIRRYLASL